MKSILPLFIQVPYKHQASYWITSSFLFMYNYNSSYSYGSYDSDRFSIWPKAKLIGTSTYQCCHTGTGTPPATGPREPCQGTGPPRPAAGRGVKPTCPEHRPALQAPNCQSPGRDSPGPGHHWARRPRQHPPVPAASGRAPRLAPGRAWPSLGTAPRLLPAAAPAIAPRAWPGRCHRVTDVATPAGAAP